MEEQKTAQDTKTMLPKNERIFKEFFENMNEVFWVTDSKTYAVVYVSPAYEKIWGRTCESLRANPKTWMESIHPDDLEKIENIAYENYDKESTPFSEFRIRRPDGTWRWIANRTFPIENSEGEVYRLCGISEDITQRKEAELELQQSERRYATLLAAAPVGVFQCDPEANSYFVNDRLCQLMGMTKEETKTKGWVTAIHPDDMDLVYLEWERCRKERIPFKLEYRYRHKDGKVIWVYGQAVAELNASGDVVAYIGTITDITRRLEMEEEYKRHQTEYAHLARLNTAGEMLSGIAHELNQPLASICQYLSGSIVRMEKENVSPEIVRVLKKTEAQALRAGAILHQYRNFLKKNELDYKKVNVNTLVEEAISLVQHELIQENIKLKISAAKNLPLVLVDKVQVEQVLLNILNNAIDAMKSISVNKRRLDISIAVFNDKFIEVSILDSGSGLSQELKGNLFHPFVSTKKNGMGIGLSISKEILNQHGGELLAENSANSGAKFKFTLPVYTEE